MKQRCGAMTSTFSPQRTYLAKVEAAIGVPATYFVQVSSRYYSIFEPEIPPFCGRLLYLADIGLHFDPEVCAHRPIPDYDERTVSLFSIRRVVDTSVTAFTLHNPTTLEGFLISFSGWTCQ